MSSVDIVYTDIAKAFDSVSHCKLLSVLVSYGIQCHVLSWIKSFLTDCSRSVCIRNTSSKFLPLLSGVLLDSILGPLLFVVYIDELFRSIESHPTCHLLLYADDAKVFSTLILLIFNVALMI